MAGGSGRRRRAGPGEPRGQGPSLILAGPISPGKHNGHLAVAVPFSFIELRRAESNHLPPGYEPGELPVLYSALQLYGIKLLLSIPKSVKLRKRAVRVLLIFSNMRQF